MTFENIGSEEVLEQYMRNRRLEGVPAFQASRHAQHAMGVMARHRAFVEEAMSEIGQHLLEDAEARMTSLFDASKVKKLSDDEQAEIRALNRIVLRWQERINAYMAAQAKLQS